MWNLVLLNLDVIRGVTRVLFFQGDLIAIPIKARCGTEAASFFGEDFRPSVLVVGPWNFTNAVLTENR
jgi:hypothetical protein